jgi:next-to-BRCA1 protein 1
LQAGQHGHDPRHEFVRADESVSLKPEDQALLAKGRNTNHAALCDSCDKSILGIRYKCIDCPDWDYCNDCIGASRQTHPGHRFVSVLDNQSIWPQCSFKMFNTVSHYGVYCDGPICQKNGRDGGCIQGVRYKCAICPDTDFCASCEASPMNKHNHTHPLIKLKIPIRNVLVTTTDEKDTVMGDIPNTSSEPKRPTVATSTSNTATQVQTIADVKPTEDDPAPVEQKVSVKENPLFFNDNEPVSLGARFVIEVVADGTVMNVGERFTQTWYMKNSGKAAWPAGVTVQFVAGDYMFLKSDEDSLDATVTDSEVQPGEIVGFSVGLTPTWPPNKYYTSYWRLTAPDGRRFGENIWCCINVKEPEPVKSKKVEEEATQIRQEESIEEEFKETSEHNDDSKDNSKDLNDGPEADKDSDTFSSQSVADMDSIRDDKEEFETVAENLVKSQASSEMVFPKLPVESPIHSLEHLPSSSTSDNSGVIIPPSPASSSSHKTFALSEDGDIEEEAEISSLDGFMTDEEYDVLDASDEEFERVA